MHQSSNVTQQNLQLIFFSYFLRTFRVFLSLSLFCVYCCCLLYVKKKNITIADFLFGTCDTSWCAAFHPSPFFFLFIFLLHTLCAISQLTLLWIQRSMFDD